MEPAKPCSLAKRDVWEAYQHVTAHQGAAGGDGQSMAACERDRPHHRSKLWNRLSSGSDFPPPVRRVDIPKGAGRTRPLGLPTVADRIAQTVVKRYLEPEVEKIFHPDADGSRLETSALDAVGQARERGWRDDGVLDLDIQGVVDTSDHELRLRAVREHTDCPWGLLSSERWRTAPVPRPDGTRVTREKGTPRRFHPGMTRRFTFWGFEFFWKVDRQGVLRVKRRTARKTLQRACKRIKAWIQANRHMPENAFFSGLNARWRGHYSYSGVHGNSNARHRFFDWAMRCAFKWLNRRGGKRRSFSWQRFTRLLDAVPIERPRPTELSCRRVYA